MSIKQTLLFKDTKLLQKNKEKNITKVRFIDLPENVKEIKHNKKAKFIAQKSFLAKKETKKENPLLKSKPKPKPQPKPKVKLKPKPKKSVVITEKIPALPSNKTKKTSKKKNPQRIKKIKKVKKNEKIKKVQKIQKLPKIPKEKKEIISLNKISPNFAQLLAKGLIGKYKPPEKKINKNQSKVKNSNEYKNVEVKRLSPNIFKPSHIYPDDIDISDSVSISTESSRFASYLHKVKRKIELVWEYPPIAGEMGIQGRLFIKFVIYKDGRLIGIKLLKSSGSPILDREAIRALKEAAPYPPFPKDNSFGVNKIKIHACFEYVISGKEIW